MAPSMPPPIVVYYKRSSPPGRLRSRRHRIRESYGSMKPFVRLLALFTLILPLVATSGSVVPASAEAHSAAPPALASASSAPTSGRTGIPRCTVALDGASTTSSTDVVIATCTLTVASASTIVILADGSLNLFTSGTEVRVILRVDNTIVLTQYAEDPPFVLRRAIPVGAGSHTITLSIARQSGGTGAIQVLQGNLNVFGIANTRTDIKVCGASVATPFVTTSATYGTLAYCAIQAPSAGTVLILGSANQYFVDDLVEANYRVGVPGVSTLPNTDRSVDVWGNSGDGHDAAVSVMGSLPVTAGQTIEVGMLARRESGSGTVGVRQSSVIGIFLPRVESLPWCGLFTDGVVEAFPSKKVAECTLTLTRGSSLIVISDMSAGAIDPYQGRDVRTDTFVDGANQSTVIHRDTFIDGIPIPLDLVIPASTITSVTKGVHTVSVVADPFWPEVDFTDPGILAIALEDSAIYLPLVVR